MVPEHCMREWKCNSSSITISSTRVFQFSNIHSSALLYHWANLYWFIPLQTEPTELSGKMENFLCPIRKLLCNCNGDISGRAAGWRSSITHEVRRKPAEMGTVCVCVCVCVCVILRCRKCANYKFCFISQIIYKHFINISQSFWSTSYSCNAEHPVHTWFKCKSMVN